MSRPQAHRLVAVLTILAVALNIGLNLLLAPCFGIMAAAINTLAAFAVLFVMALIIGQRVFPARYQRAGCCG